MLLGRDITLSLACIFVPMTAFLGQIYGKFNSDFKSVYFQGLSLMAWKYFEISGSNFPVETRSSFLSVKKD